MQINPTIKMASPHLNSTTPGYKKKTQILFNKAFLSWSQDFEKLITAAINCNKCRGFRQGRTGTLHLDERVV
jgi:hypothetical protein